MTYVISTGCIVFRYEPLSVCLVFTHDKKWGFPKGGRKRCETVIEAALRELYEETGLGSTDIEPLHKDLYVEQKPSKQRVKMRTRYYITSLTGEPELNPIDKREIIKCRFMSIKEAMRVLNPRMSRALREALEIKGIVLRGIPRRHQNKKVSITSRGYKWALNKIVQTIPLGLHVMNWIIHLITWILLHLEEIITWILLCLKELVNYSSKVIRNYKL